MRCCKPEAILVQVVAFIMERPYYWVAMAGGCRGTTRIVVTTLGNAWDE